MKILHTADWHIGKRLAGFDLTADQDYVFDQLVACAQREQVDAIAIAGDLYDRALANEDAVSQVNRMLYRLNRELHYPLLVISGNHDSAVRLGTGRQWFSATGLHLNTELAEAFTPVEMGDVQFFLLPYFEPVAARQYFHDDSLTNISLAMHRVSAELQTRFDSAKKHVLFAHFFAANSTQTDSETKVAVGGLDAVDVADLAAFDYVGLGHLHNRNALTHVAGVQYAGSLLKFSTSEIAQEKGVYILDTATMARRFVPLKPLHEFQHLTDAFAALTAPDAGERFDRDAYTAVTLTDAAVIPNVMTALREVFPRITGLDREQAVQLNRAAAADPTLGPLPLLAEFFRQVTDTELDDAQLAFARTALDGAKKEGN
ncbi:exonuclease SbcCD subunit D [Lacticaseibacillus kribbianus]|uniref:exonuclease SbcCD subunit D n=1 Tax=Lacticaseibacillus kribbianus TaxID=2926292 RepID=UPI001CD7B05D|nr:exonuclease SbcCD subunit D [Lacticaseibacillus kribbianus]